jgi:hypothetical protein
MPKLMHATRRGPGEIVLVNGAKLELDEQGCVQATVEQAAKLLQGGLWRDPEHWAKHPQKAVAVPPPLSDAPGAGRRVRTPEEMAAVAAEAGVSVPTPTSEEPPQESKSAKRRGPK